MTYHLVELTVIIILLSTAATLGSLNIIGTLRRRRRSKGYGISLLVPFTGDGAERERNWHWLRAYWRESLPLAQIVEVASYERPFCKTAAVNEAFSRSSGDVVAILDADAYLDACTLLKAAWEIRADRRNWFVPYQRMYRLTERVTSLVVESDPDDPLTLTDPPPAGAWISENGQSTGHWYGALCQIMPREAFEAVKGMDPRFRGWGGEDVSLMHSIDTLYSRHKTLNAPAYHLWHRSTSAGTGNAAKRWDGQPRAVMNSQLTSRYSKAFNDPEAMRRLISERDG
jgi:glycosyltransferase involved in cell wall biosynthesis